MKIIPCLMLIFAVAVLSVFHSRAASPDTLLSSVLDATYMIEKMEIHFIGGRSEIPVAPGSAAKITTMVFGKPALKRTEDCKFKDTWHASTSAW